MSSIINIGLLERKGGEYLLAVQIPKVQELIDKIRILEGRKWDPENMRWTVPIAHLKRLKEIFPTAIYSEGIAKLEENTILKQKHLSEEFKQLTNGLDLTQPLKNGKILFQHQKESVLRLLKFKRQILALDMGLGKTLTSLVAAKILTQQYGWTIKIIVPVSLAENWDREAQSLGISKMMYSIHSWSKIPDPGIKEFILIADESHYAQAGNKSQRGKAFLELANSAFCRAMFALTGTPMKNGRPINLLPLLVAAKHELSKDVRYFHIRYCNARPSRFSRWDTTGAAHLDELAIKVKDVMIRKTKSECLDLPEKLRVIRKAELSKESEKLYKDTLAELKRKYEERISRGDIVGGGEALVMLGQLAHAGALGKVETAIELAEEVLEEGNQVVIFCTYTKPLNMLYERFREKNISTELLIGDTKDRQQLVDRFLAKKSKVFLLSMAGGVGIDLYTATTIILINRPWTPGDAAQIEDRLHRIGQKNNVTAVWLQYGEIDERVDEILQAKTHNIDRVLEGGKINSFAKNYLNGI